MVTAEAMRLIDPRALAAARADLGAAFARILGYFREDGVKSVAAIEAAARAQTAAGLVIPAHTLKGEARQFGAMRLGDLAEAIEMAARDCVETRDRPTAIVEQVIALRPLFLQTLAELEREANPPVVRRAPGGFGRKIA